MANGGGVPPKEIFSEFLGFSEPNGQRAVDERTPSFESVMELRGTSASLAFFEVHAT